MTPSQNFIAPPGPLTLFILYLLHTGSYRADKSPSNLCQRFLFPDIMANSPVLVREGGGGCEGRGDYRKFACSVGSPDSAIATVIGTGMCEREVEVRVSIRPKTCLLYVLQTFGAHRGSCPMGAAEMVPGTRS
jgi:hypothetical protein